MSDAIHRNTDARSCGSKTTVSGQGNVFINGLLASVAGDQNLHGGGELLATVNDGTIFINGKKVVLKGSNSSPDTKSRRLVGGRPHINSRAIQGSPDVFAGGGIAPSGSSSAAGNSAGSEIADQQEPLENAPTPSDTNFTQDGICKGMEVSEQLQADGFNKAGAAGIVGNILVESDQFRADTEYGNPSAGRGWLQWTGSRRTNFENYASAHGLNPTSDEANYNYLIYEMQGYDGNHWSPGFSLDEYQAITDPTAASDYFMNGYERPGVPNRQARVDGSQAIYDESEDCPTP